MNASSDHFNHGEHVAVLTSVSIDKYLDYAAPEGGVRIGDFVVVPLGKRRAIGVVWKSACSDVAPEKVRFIEKRIDVPSMTKDYMKFLEMIAVYTVTPLNVIFGRATRVPDVNEKRPVQVFYRYSGAVPEKLTKARQKVLEVFRNSNDAMLLASQIIRETKVSSSVIKGLERQGVLERKEVFIEHTSPEYDLNCSGSKLNKDQQHAAEQLLKMLDSRTYATVLLKGVAGAGKTEVYLEAVAKALTMNRQVLVLLPEIALTSQFIDRVELRFGIKPLQWHSAVSKAEKKNVWRMTAEGKAKLIVGARSALFLPFFDLGLVVVDEEHDESFKQDEGVIYNARDMAILRGSICNALVILSSATPSLETWVNARNGKYSRLDLDARFGSAGMPLMDTIDMRDESLPRGKWISEALAKEVFERIANNQQTLLFINRRGYAPISLCRSCGYQLGCSDCDARLTMHRYQEGMMCHQCGARSSIPKSCPECGVGGKLAQVGPGVERLAEEAANTFRDARIVILSSDLIGTTEQFRETLETITNGDVDIIIGTQLVAKGHNFPRLTLVGVIDADVGLQGGDIRAAEKTFQLIRQVAGRAGRAELTGTALLQTWQPDHPVMRAIISGNDEEFWAAEAAEREFASVPPFGQYVSIIVSGRDPVKVQDFATTIALEATEIDQIGATLYGPAPAPILRIRGNTRLRMLIHAERSFAVQRAIRNWLGQFRIPANIKVAIDVDPQRFL